MSEWGTTLFLVHLRTGSDKAKMSRLPMGDPMHSDGPLLQLTVR